MLIMIFMLFVGRVGATTTTICDGKGDSYACNVYTGGGLPVYSVGQELLDESASVSESEPDYLNDTATEDVGENSSLDKIEI